MCVAVPRRVVEVGRGRVRVDVDGERRWVALSPGVAPAVGSYVAVYAGLALEALSDAEAEEQLALMRELGSLLEAEDAE